MACSRLDQVDDTEAGQRFGETLHQRTGERRRRCRTCLRRDSNVGHEAEFRDTHKHLRVLFTETQRRDDRTTAERAKRTFKECPFFTEIGVEQVDQNVYVLDDSNAEGKRLVGAGEFGIGNVDMSWTKTSPLYSAAMNG